MAASIERYQPLTRDPKMARSRARTGNDIRGFDVYCPNPCCASIIDRNGYGGHPRMNYHGTKFSLVQHRRVHVFACSLCNGETRYRRKWFGKEWHRI